MTGGRERERFHLRGNCGPSPVNARPHLTNPPMQSVNKSVLVPYGAAAMFELVDRIDLYPQFLPWCAGADVLEVRADGKTARLDIAFHGVKTHFTTDNRNRAPESIIVTLKDGPFRHLHGEWRFHALAPDACNVELELAYEFATPLLGRVVGPVFGHIANTFIDAFVRRAEAVYEARP
jgi:ribosome-associated toxin RatA of RatAB toxin-antitoxin module